MATTTWDQKAGMTSPTGTDNIEDYAEQAEASKDAAAASETAAATSATAAADSATAAAGSSSAASTSATAANTSASSAASSATAAGGSASAAATSATAASASETAAASSEAAAATSATNAATSATSASGSASSASTDASAASTSATASAASATAASASETNAAASKTAAASSAAASASSATDAAASEAAAAASETAAASSEAAAATSASTASTSAANAATSETNSASSASAAASSATSASASADAALAALDSFDDRYLGQKASDPALDNDGNALVAGALYFNTTDDVMKVYDGSVWVAAYASLSGALLQSNNLSDVLDVALSRTNLGLGAGDTPTFAGINTTGNVTFGDNDKAVFGAGSDLQIFHTGTSSWIRDLGTGGLVIDTDGSNIDIKGSSPTEYMARFIKDGAVSLYYDNALKLATTSTGVDVTGTITSDGLTVDGADGEIVRIASTVDSGTQQEFGIGFATNPSHTHPAAQILAKEFDASDSRAGLNFYTRPDNSDTASVKRLNIDTDGDISFYEDTGTTPKFFWDASAESLGIGTSSPTQLLHLTSSAPRLKFEESDTSQSFQIGLGGGNFLLVDENTGNIPFIVRSSAPSNSLLVDSSGNVGIGGSPAGGIKLDVVGKVNVDERLTVDHSNSGSVWIGDNSSTSTDNRYVALYNDNGLRLQTRTDAGVFVSNDYLVQTDASGATSHRWQVANSEKMRINSSGNVGIGTSSPEEKLHVEGSLKVDFGSAGGNPRVYLDHDSATDDGNYLQLNRGDDGLEVVGQDNVKMRTNGSEAMRIDSSGNVGIGTTSPAEALTVAGGSIQLKGTTYTDFSDYWGVNDNTAIFTPYGYLGSNGSFSVSLFSNGYRNSGGGFTSMGNGGLSTASGIELTPSGLIQFRTGTPSGTSVPERMRIDSNGRVGIGTSSPSDLLDLSSADPRIRLTNTGSGYALVRTGGSDASLILEADAGNTGAGSDIIMRVDGSEKLRIDSNGKLLLGTTDTTMYNNSSGSQNGVVLMSLGRVEVAAESSDCMRLNRMGTDGGLAYFYNDGSNVGNISVTGASTAYNTSSDYRLKTDAQPMTGASARVQALNPVNFEWIADGTRVDGFLAHEAQAVVPEAVTGTKDAMRDEEYEVTPAVLDDDGNVVTEAVMGTRSVPDYQGIDQSKLVPLLTAALQEALTKIDALETRITALEG